MAKAPIEIRSLARSYTNSALKTLVAIMTEISAPAAARVSAAQALLDRGWGKPTQPIGGDKENPLVIEKIEWVIVDHNADRGGPGV